MSTSKSNNLRKRANSTTPARITSSQSRSVSNYNSDDDNNPEDNDVPAQPVTKRIQQQQNNNNKNNNNTNTANGSNYVSIQILILSIVLSFISGYFVGTFISTRTTISVGPSDVQIVTVTTSTVSDSVVETSKVKPEPEIVTIEDPIASNISPQFSDVLTETPSTTPSPPTTSSSPSIPNITHFFHLIETNSFDELFSLCTNNPKECSLTERDSLGNTALHHAIIHSVSSRVFTFLLDLDPTKIDTKNRQGRTALFEAIVKLNPILTEILLDRDADSSLFLDNDDRTFSMILILENKDFNPADTEKNRNMEALLGHERVKKKMGPTDLYLKRVDRFGKTFDDYRKERFGK